MVIAISLIPILGCISISTFIDMDTDGSGKGAIYQTLTFPATNDTGESMVSLFDSYIARLKSEGWESIQTIPNDGGLAKISAVYYFDLAADKNLPESLAGFSLKVEENDDGTKIFSFEGTYDYSEFMETWNSIRNSETYDFGPLFGEKVIMTQEQVNQYIDRYGEPVFETKVRLAGSTPIEATGAWTNADDYLNGRTDSLVFSWSPGMIDNGSLYAVSQYIPGQTSDLPATTEETATASFVDGDLIGMPCTDYCLSLDPIGFWTDGDTYPDCKCDCGDGNQFLQLKCISNADLCSGEGMRLITDKDRPGMCMCTDPNKKYDVATQKCVDLDGTECNHGNGCEPEYGENCSNCSDCGCSFGSGENSQYNPYLTCNPSNGKADLYGCVFEPPDKTTQLEIMKEEWKQCRDAWALLNLSGGYGMTGYQTEVMGAIADLPKVQTWQQKSGCIPTAGVVLGREEVDPLVCLIRYCDRINTSIRVMEQNNLKDSPVIHGPGIKVNPPTADITLGPLQVPQFSGELTLYGNRTNSILPVFGAGFAESEYEIVSHPETGMEIYLYEGSFTYTYFDSTSASFKQEVLSSGEYLSIDANGLVISHQTFDSASREPWWNDVDYLVNCPENSEQKGADCYCLSGYRLDAELEQCISAAELSSGAQNEDVLDSLDQEEKTTFQKLLPLLMYYIGIVIIAIVILIIFLTRKQKK